MATYILLAVLLSIGSKFVYTKSILNHGEHSGQNLDNTRALNYLIKYGWLDYSDLPVEVNSQQVMRDAIADFQRFAGLEATGDIDEPTKTLMASARCGFRDVTTIVNKNRKKRYAPTATPWPKSNLSWFLENDSNDNLSRADIEREIRRALQRWADASGLTFFKASDASSADIRLSFQVRNHSEDSLAFDGPGGSIGHAFPPGIGIGGDVHFDDDDVFRIHETGRYNFHQVATHELGHSLGIGHSSDRTAVMAPFYQDINPDDFHLQPADISYIRSLYGSPGDVSTPTTLRATHRPTTQPTTLAPVTTQTIRTSEESNASHMSQTPHHRQTTSRTHPTTLTSLSTPSTITSDVIGDFPVSETAHPRPTTSRAQATTLAPTSTPSTVTSDVSGDFPVSETAHPRPTTSRTHSTTLAPTSTPSTITSDVSGDFPGSQTAHPIPSTSRTYPTTFKQTLRPSRLTSNDFDASPVSSTTYPRPNTSRTYPTKLVPTSIPSTITGTSDEDDAPIVSQVINARPFAYKRDQNILVAKPKASNGSKAHTVQTGIHCNAQFDAATETSDEEVYFFQGEQVFKVRPSIGIVDGYPKRLSEEFSGLNLSFIDAALTYHVNSTFTGISIFKSDNYWLFDQRGAMQPGYPKNIALNWRGVPSNLDAAFTWIGNGFVYFIKGNQYYKFNLQRRRVQAGYPRRLRIWQGVESPVDGVFKYENQTLFLRGQYYQIFDGKNFTANDKVPSAPEWLGCAPEGIEKNVAIETTNSMAGLKSSCDLVRNEYVLTWIIYGLYLLR